MARVGATPRAKTAAVGNRGARGPAADPQGAPLSITPKLGRKGLSLKPLERAQVSLLHRWESDTTTLHLWSARRSILSEEEYEESLRGRFRDSVHVFLVVSDHGERPVGFIYSHDVNLVDGFAFVTAFLEPAARGRGLGAKAGLLFFNYLFSYFPLRKLYCEAYDYNQTSCRLLIAAGFSLEGEFREHRFFGGSYHTLSRYALFRENFYSRFPGLLGRMVGTC